MLDKDFKLKFATILLSRLKRNVLEDTSINLKPIMKAFLPFFLMFISVTLSVAVIHHGISLSLEYNNWTIFSRSGSLLIVIALVSVLIDHSIFYKSIYLAISNENIAKNSVVIDKVIRRKIKQTLKKYNFQKSSNEIEYLLSRERKLFSEYAYDEISNWLSTYSRRIELILGVTGTIIWGFGDLISKLF